MNKIGFLLILSFILLTGCTRVDSYTCTIVKSNIFEKISVTGSFNVKEIVVTKSEDYLATGKNVLTLEKNSVDLSKKLNVIKGITYKYNFKNDIFNQIISYDIDALALSDRKNIDFINSKKEVNLDETIKNLVEMGYDCTKDN